MIQCVVSYTHTHTVTQARKHLYNTHKKSVNCTFTFATFRYDLRMILCVSLQCYSTTFVPITIKTNYIRYVICDMMGKMCCCWWLW